jgi:dTDP-4-dehydrorhamnose 3,5-epimerase
MKLKTQVDISRTVPYDDPLNLKEEFMEVIDLALSGLKLIRQPFYPDERGFFKEFYRRDRLAKSGIDLDFVQDNHSFSKKGVIRGMHFQLGAGQAKLVAPLVGEIYDVVVDIRKESPTFGQWLGVTLSAKEHEQLFVPVGFAHGFCSLSDEVHLLYKVSSLYDPLLERGFRFDDPEVGIKWPLLNPILSAKDLASGRFSEVCP